MRAYAREIEVDEEAFVEAFREVPAMSREQFGCVAQALFTLARQLSTTAYQNVQQARFITARKLAEAALQESEALLSRSQAIGHIGSWEFDVVANRLTWSDEVYRMFGLRPQEFGATYEAFFDAVHPDDRAAVDAAYTESLREGRDGYEIEHRVVRRDTGNSASFTRNVSTSKTP